MKFQEIWVVFQVQNRVSLMLGNPATKLTIVQEVFLPVSHQTGLVRDTLISRIG
jgi:hypothetical protein